MSKADEDRMTQCSVKRERDHGFDTRWLPGTGWKTGHRFRIKTTDDWWVVTEVGEVWPTERVLAHERDYVTMPTVTDAFPDGHGGRRLPVRPR